MRSGHWLFAFGIAAIATAVATRLLRRLALAAGFVDRPGPIKSHTHDTPYLGGVGIAAVALGAWLFGHDLGSRLAVVIAAATAVAVVGLLDDIWGLGPWVRLAAEASAAAAVVSVGLHVDVMSISAVDGALTVVCIVGVANALNLMDNMDGLAAGTALVSTGGVFVLAALGDQDGLAVAAAGLAGACAGFLVYNWRPAVIFMGDAGALFLGFALAVATLEVHPGVTRPGSLGVRALLVALPAFDVALVSAARLRRGRPVMSGGKDHSSHRLVALGLHPGVAVALLIGVQALLTTLAVLSGRAVLPVWLALLASAGLLGTLGAVVAPVRVYDTPAVGLRARLRSRTAPRPTAPPAVPSDKPQTRTVSDGLA